MKKRKIEVFQLLLLCYFVLFSAGCSGGEPEQTGSPRVLFLGNSYTYFNKMPQMFAHLARSGGDTVDVGMSAPGGWTLREHQKAGRTRKKLDEKKWDFVVLQEQSVIPSVPGTREKEMYPAARVLDGMIRAKGARTIFFMTWGRRGGFLRYRHRSFGDMQRALYEGYTTIARELRARVAPVGPAWKRAMEKQPGLDLWGKDGSHPNKSGSYLAACVFYAVIYKKSPVGLSFHADLSPEAAAFLQQTAAETVLK